LFVCLLVCELLFEFFVTNILSLKDLAPLPEILELKKSYPFRLILDESYSIGVLGATGRGVTQHFGIADFSGRYATTQTGERLQDMIEIITASIGHAVGGIGGFSVGSTAICNHQVSSDLKFFIHLFFSSLLFSSLLFSSFSYILHFYFIFLCLASELFRLCVFMFASSVYFECSYEVVGTDQQWEGSTIVE
jgi:hypothetical protein